MDGGNLSGGAGTFQHRRSPIDAVKERVQLPKRSWGKNLSGNGSIGIVFGLMLLMVSLVAALLIGGPLAMHSQAGVILTAVIIIVWFVLISLVQSSLQGHYSAALHGYFDVGEASIQFDQTRLQDALSPKES